MMIVVEVILGAVGNDRRGWQISITSEHSKWYGRDTSN